MLPLLLSQREGEREKVAREECLRLRLCKKVGVKCGINVKMKGLNGNGRRVIIWVELLLWREGLIEMSVLC